MSDSGEIDVAIVYDARVSARQAVESADAVIAALDSVTKKAGEVSAGFTRVNAPLVGISRLVAKVAAEEDTYEVYDDTNDLSVAPVRKFM